MKLNEVDDIWPTEAGDQRQCLHCFQISVNFEIFNRGAIWGTTIGKLLLMCGQICPEVMVLIGYYFPGTKAGDISRSHRQQVCTALQQ